jgi:hypothetical protein
MKRFCYSPADRISWLSTRTTERTENPSWKFRPSNGEKDGRNSPRFRAILFWYQLFRLTAAPLSRLGDCTRRFSSVLSLKPW